LGAKDAFDDLLREAETDPLVLAMILYGSQASGLATDGSDYDFVMIVEALAETAWSARLDALDRGELDGRVLTSAAFESWADWNGPQRWLRYALTSATVLLDRTGEAQALIDAKTSVPQAERAKFIDASLDHFVNQVYRCAKCRRDGDALAAKLEAVAAIEPLLDAIFALDGGRVRPYAKYLSRDLVTRPPASLPMTPADFVANLERILAGDDLPALQALLAAIASVARAAGHADVLDAWGETLDWTLAARSQPD
jgi:hypothetical protein